MSFEAPNTALANVSRVATGKKYGETEIYYESDVTGVATIGVVQISTKS